jgi:hypothetical protein
MSKTIFEALPELEAIARELGVNINNWKVIEEYFQRTSRRKKSTRIEIK